MKTTQQSKVLFMAQAAMIAAIYVVLTMLGASFAFGEVQIRFSEALTILPAITPAGIPGEGEGADRKTTTVACSSGAGTGLNRRELYTDARDVSSTVDNETLTDAEYKAQLSQRGLENLAENIATKSFEGKVETTRMYRYGEDFFLGDMVQIVNEYGIEGKARVTEFIRSQSKEGLDSYPTFVTVE